MPATAADPFETYRAERLAEGFDEVVPRAWEPHVEVAEHRHPFSVKARIVEGEMWLEHGGRVQHLKAGDGFELDADVPHAERYGPAGATYWAARRHAQAPGTKDR